MRRRGGRPPRRSTKSCRRRPARLPHARAFPTRNARRMRVADGHRGVPAERAEVYNPRSASRVSAPPPGSTLMTWNSQPPQADGLYDPSYEHDACGVAMIARLDNEPSHEVIDRALTALENLEHRGAEGADTRTGDGAGILTQLPDAFFRGVCDFELPPAGQYGVGMCFLPADEARRDKLEQLIELNARIEGQQVLGWRDVPVDEAHVGDTANRSRPTMRQIFIGAGEGFTDDQDAFERKLYVIRRIVELAAGPDFYSPSFSSRTVVYKGMLISHQLRCFYPDLQDER